MPRGVCAGGTWCLSRATASSPENTSAHGPVSDWERLAARHVMARERSRRPAVASDGLHGRLPSRASGLAAVTSCSGCAGPPRHDDAGFLSTHVLSTTTCTYTRQSGLFIYDIRVFKRAQPNFEAENCDLCGRVGCVCVFPAWLQIPGALESAHASATNAPTVHSQSIGSPLAPAPLRAKKSFAWGSNMSSRTVASRYVCIATIRARG